MAFGCRIFFSVVLLIGSAFVIAISFVTSNFLTNSLLNREVPYWAGIPLLLSGLFAFLYLSCTRNVIHPRCYHSLLKLSTFSLCFISSFAAVVSCYYLGLRTYEISTYHSCILCSRINRGCIASREVGSKTLLNCICVQEVVNISSAYLVRNESDPIRHFRIVAYYADVPQGEYFGCAGGIQDVLKISLGLNSAICGLSALICFVFAALMYRDKYGSARRDYDLTTSAYYDSTDSTRFFRGSLVDKTVPGDYQPGFYYRRQEDLDSLWPEANPSQPHSTPLLKFEDHQSGDKTADFRPPLVSPIYTAGRRRFADCRKIFDQSCTPQRPQLLQTYTEDPDSCEMENLLYHTAAVLYQLGRSLQATNQSASATLNSVLFATDPVGVDILKCRLDGSEGSISLTLTHVNKTPKFSDQIAHNRSKSPAVCVVDVNNEYWV